MRVYIETERLLLRPLTPDDAEAVFRWGGDPAVNEYMIYPLYHRAEDVRRWLEGRDPDNPDSYDEGITLRDTGELIGSGGLVFHPERGAWEIGYNLRADCWGRGYTGEMLRALMDHIRASRPLEAIDGIFAAANRKSRRVMEKLGMTFVRDTEYTKLDGSRTYPAKYYRRDFPPPADTSGLTVRRFREEDAQAVSDLVRAALLVTCAKDYPPEPLGTFARNQTAACMSERARATHFYVAAEGETAVGCGAVGPDETNPDACCVYSFYVLPSRQGHGIGKAIMRRLEADELFRRARRATLHASKNALGFYRRMGFGFAPGGETPDRDGLFVLERSIPV